MTPRGQGSGRALAKTKPLLTPALDPVTEPMSPRAPGTRRVLPCSCPADTWGCGSGSDFSQFLTCPMEQRTWLPHRKLLLGSVRDSRELQLCVSPQGVWCWGLNLRTCACCYPQPPSNRIKEEEQKTHWVHDPGGGWAGVLSVLPPTPHPHTQRLDTGWAPHSANGLLLLEQEEAENRETWNNWGAIDQVPGRSPQETSQQAPCCQSLWTSSPWHCRAHQSSKAGLGKGKAFPIPA